VITAIDSNVLIDVLTADEEDGSRSGEAVRRALAEGSIVACDVVVAEVASWFPRADVGAEALRTLGSASIRSRRTPRSPPVERGGPTGIKGARVHV
jgi:predicted nucleic acid-binding protein